jgi:ATP-dependent Clp protease ATP-binding subunit ClpA
LKAPEIFTESQICVIKWAESQEVHRNTQRRFKVVNSNDANRMFQSAGQAAQIHFNDRIIRPEYLLFAMVDHPDRTGVAFQVLGEFGVDVGQFKTSLIEFIRNHKVVHASANEPQRWSEEMGRLSKEAEGLAQSWANHNVGTGHYLHCLTRSPELQRFWKTTGLNLNAVRVRIERLYMPRSEGDAQKSL